MPMYQGAHGRIVGRPLFLRKSCKEMNIEEVLAD